MSLKWRDNEEFFRMVSASGRDARALVSGYAEFHGDMNWGKQDKVIEALAFALGAPFSRAQIFGSDGELLPGFYDMVLPGGPYPYLKPTRDEVLSQKVVMDAGPNQWRDSTLPTPMNMRLGQAQRPAYEIYALSDVDLFIGPYSYQTYRPSQGTYWPLASSRAFSKGVDRYPELEFGRPVVICQDQYDCGNIAHFLYDSVPRICLFAETFPADARNAVFLFGGDRAPFHDYFLAMIGSKYGLDAPQFHFPEDYANLRRVSRVYFFSDQRQRIVHPLNICHPRSLNLVRSLVGKLDRAPGFENLFISRADAGLRKLINEPELTTALRKFNFKRVCMSDFSVTDQISFLANAQHIVAPHGMGLSYLPFNNMNGASLTELFNPRVGSDAYALVSRAVGMQYQFVMGEPVLENPIDYRVAIDAVVDAVQRL